MSTMDIFDTPEILSLVLKNLEVKEQLVVRRVNKQFKQVVEHDIWRTMKTFDLQQFENIFDETPIEIWETMLSNMSNLRKVNLLSRGQDENKILRDNFIGLLVKYCPKIDTFDYFQRYKNWALEYFRQLGDKKMKVSKVKTFLGKNSFKVYLRMVTSLQVEWTGDDLDMLAGDLEDFMDKSIERAITELQHYDFSNLDDQRVMLVMERIGNFSNLTNLFLSSITNLNLMQFVQLKSLDLYLEARVFDYGERDRIDQLTKYLLSDASSNLTSLDFEFTSLDIINQFIFTLSNLDRPKKWKKIALKTKNFSYFSSSNSLVLCFPIGEPFVPPDYLFPMLGRSVTPSEFWIRTKAEKLSIQEHELEMWISWIENFAATNRKIKFQFAFKDHRGNDDGEMNVGDANWSLNYHSYMRR